jgi:acyl-CoA reductase-like NAD-dependent aldehyde dehydrogenase
MTLQAAPNPSQRKQTVTITATVTPVAPGAGIPTGSVQLMEGKKRIGTATLVNGMAVFQASFTGMGEQVLTATYPGESLFFGSSSTLTQVLTR